jgi:hypothetical protein
MKGKGSASLCIRLDNHLVKRQGIESLNKQDEVGV